jgi:hypothetical protein
MRSMGGTTSGQRGWGLLMEGPPPSLTYTRPKFRSPSLNQFHSGRITGECYLVSVIIYIFVGIIKTYNFWLGKKILRLPSGDFVLYLYPILCSSSIGLVPDTLTVRSASQVWPSLRGKVDLIYRCKRVTSIDNHITVSIPRKVSLIKNYFLGFLYICILKML